MLIPDFLRAQPEGVLLRVKLQPRASINGVAGPQGQELRIRVTAPPVDSAANEALVHLLAELLDCGRNRVELVRGHNSQHKALMLHGFTVDQVLRRLEQAKAR